MMLARNTVQRYFSSYKPTNRGAKNNRPNQSRLNLARPWSNFSWTKQ